MQELFIIKGPDAEEHSAKIKSMFSGIQESSPNVFFANIAPDEEKFVPVEVGIVRGSKLASNAFDQVCEGLDESDYFFAKGWKLNFDRQEKQPRPGDGLSWDAHGPKNAP